MKTSQILQISHHPASNKDMDMQQQVVIKDVPDRGDCFYQALFRAAKARGLLVDLILAFNNSADSVHEEVFCFMARHSIADFIQDDPGCQEGIMLMYTVMRDDVGTSSIRRGPNWEGRVRELGRKLGVVNWLSDFFATRPELNLSNADTNSTRAQLDEFSEFSDAAMRAEHAYAGGMEVSVTKKFLRNMGMTLVIEKSVLRFPTVPAGRTLYLLHVNNNHFNWIEYTPLFSQEKNAAVQNTTRLRQAPSQSNALANANANVQVQSRRANANTTQGGSRAKKAQVKVKPRKKPSPGKKKKRLQPAVQVKRKSK